MGRADEIGAPRVVGGQGHDERCGEGERHGARDGRPPGQGGRWSGKTPKRRPKTGQVLGPLGIEGDDGDRAERGVNPGDQRALPLAGRHHRGRVELANVGDP